VSCTNVSHRLGSAWWCQWEVKGEGKILMLFGVWCQMIIVFTSLWVTLMRFWPLTSLIIMLPSNYCRADFYNSMIYIHICELWFYVGMKKGIQTCQHMSLQLSEWKRVTRLSLANAGWTSLYVPLYMHMTVTFVWTGHQFCLVVLFSLFFLVRFLIFMCAYFILLVFFVRSEISITLLL
jgi:hypothetical protein